MKVKRIILLIICLEYIVCDCIVAESATALNPDNGSNIADIFISWTECSGTHSVEQDVANMSKYCAFWCAQSIVSRQPEVWKILHEQYPDKLYMHYVTPLMARPDAPSSYLDYEYIQREHPDWFLLIDEANAAPGDYRNPEKRIRYIPDDPPGSVWYDCFFLDVGNAEFQDWAVEQFMSLLAQTHPAFSGMMTDNILLDVWVAWKTKLYPNWKYAGKYAEWNQGYFAYLKKLHTKLRERGYILVLNHTTDYGSGKQEAVWTNILKIADGYTDEQALGPPLSLWGGEQWEWSLRHHETIIEKGLYDWWIFTPPVGDSEKAYQEFLYVYSSFLLVKNEKWSLFGVMGGDVNGSYVAPWYREYTLPVGEPVGPRYQREGCWWRDYQYAQIVVNPTPVPCTITLDPDICTLDWQTKRNVSQLVLEPLTSAILLRAE